MRILVIRNSAMGDVALTTPVLRAFAQTYPNDEILLVTRNNFHPFFYGLENITLINTNYQHQHKGVTGIYQLHKDIEKAGKVDMVLDLHGVIRSKMLRTLFSAKGAKVFVIDKGRKEKRELIKGELKSTLKHTVHRYMDVFDKAGFPLQIASGPSIQISSAALEQSKILLSGNRLKMGIAPFAKHSLKQWPIANMIELMQLFAETNEVSFYLFGGNADRHQLETIASSVKHSLVIAGNYSLEVELGIMANLDLMVAMDSSNMHMAALVGTPVISIWGATDPSAGFGAWGQPTSHQIYNTELNCRPCTIYGKGSCARKDFACMNQLSAKSVYERMIKTGLILT